MEWKTYDLLGIERKLISDSCDHASYSMLSDQNLQRLLQQFSSYQSFGIVKRSKPFSSATLNKKAEWFLENNTIICDQGPYDHHVLWCGTPPATEEARHEWLLSGPQGKCALKDSIPNACATKTWIEMVTEIRQIPFALLRRKLNSHHRQMIRLLKPFRIWSYV